MNTYIALLRGINISGKNLIKMADLKKSLDATEIAPVVTYIQSGNLIFKSKIDDHQLLSDLISANIKTSFKLDVPTLVLNRPTLQDIAIVNPFANYESKLQYFTFLFEEPSSEKVALFEAQDHGDELYQINEKVIYFYPAKGYGKAKLNNNLFEQKLKVSATTRNLKTVEALLSLSQEN